MKTIITVDQIPHIIQRATDGLCYVEFTKTDGSIRKMHATTKIDYVPKEGGKNRAYVPKEHGITVLKDLNLPESDCIRAVKWTAVTLLIVDSVSYTKNNLGSLDVSAK